MIVRLIAWTQFRAPLDVPWRPEFLNKADRAPDNDGQDLIEFAGRACYEAWNRANPATATNGAYVRRLIELGHFSVLEHPSVTFYIRGVSRSLTHELIRHRLFGYSQRSQRYVDEGVADMVVPDVIEADPHLLAMFKVATDKARRSYNNFYQLLEARGLPRKLARGAARSVLPNAAETRIVVSGNLRAWRHFLQARLPTEAEVEIRTLAEEIGQKLYTQYPDVFADIIEPPAVPEIIPQCTVCRQPVGDDCEHFTERLSARG